jgi:two-component sensor histidine kinase
MASLMSLHAQTLAEPTAIAALQDAEGRVQCLGTLYDHLYTASGGDRGSLKEYLEMLIVKEIELFPVGQRVETRSELAECWCPAKTLSTVGLIVNELITNAMKYAFGDHPAPVLRLTGVHQNERYQLTVEDNGPGVPAAVGATGSSGFGLMVITTLTEQLGGTITFENDHGTRATLKFPVPGGHQPERG